MTYTARISPYARKYIQARGSDLLTDTCRVTRQRAHDLDQSSNDYVHGGDELIYEGPCRLWELNTGMSVSIGEESTAVTSSVLSLPWDITPIPIMEDMVEMTGSLDGAVVGKMFRLGEPAKGGNLRGTRRFQVVTQDSTREEW